MSLVQLIDGHNPSDRKNSRPGPACYRLYRIEGEASAYSGEIVGAIDGYTGSQCINVVHPPRKGVKYGVLSGISTITVNGVVEAGSYPFCSSTVVLTPLSDDELEKLGFSVSE